MTCQNLPFGKYSSMQYPCRQCDKVKLILNSENEDASDKTLMTHVFVSLRFRQIPICIKASYPGCLAYHYKKLRIVIVKMALILRSRMVIVKISSSVTCLKMESLSMSKSGL